MASGEAENSREQNQAVKNADGVDESDQGIHDRPHIKFSVPAQRFQEASASFWYL